MGALLWFARWIGLGALAVALLGSGGQPTKEEKPWDKKREEGSLARTYALDVCPVRWARWIVSRDVSSCAGSSREI